MSASGDFTERMPFRRQRDHTRIARLATGIDGRALAFRVLGGTDGAVCSGRASGGALVVVSPGSLGLSPDAQIASATRVSMRCSRISNRSSACPRFRTR